jgi:hypothetical protein
MGRASTILAELTLGITSPDAAPGFLSALAGRTSHPCADQGPSPPPHQGGSAGTTDLRSVAEAYPPWRVAGRYHPARGSGDLQSAWCCAGRVIRRDVYTCRHGPNKWCRGVRSVQQVPCHWPKRPEWPGRPVVPLRQGPSRNPRGVAHGDGSLRPGKLFHPFYRLSKGRIALDRRIVSPGKAI